MCKCQDFRISIKIYFDSKKSGDKFYGSELLREVRAYSGHYGPRDGTILRQMRRLQAEKSINYTCLYPRTSLYQVL